MAMLAAVLRYALVVPVLVRFCVTLRADRALPVTLDSSSRCYCLLVLPGIGTVGG